MEAVNLKQVEIALEYVNGSDFEHFFQSFYPALVGTNFIPLGGMHDGGADAFQDQDLFEGKKSRINTFYQASIQQDHRAKIRHTVKRLRDFGRDPETLIYFTSRSIDLIDREEEELSTELDTGLKIRDRKWIASNVNRSPQTVAAFSTYLAPTLGFLSEPGSATIIRNSRNVSARTMCVFLGQEIDRRRGNTGLLEAVTDSLILWALEDTDPDKNELMTRREILDKIEKALPSAKYFIHGVFSKRIMILTSKGNPTGREVRWYRREDKFCLPYVTRKIVENENTEDEFLKLEILDLYKQRAMDKQRAMEVHVVDEAVLADQVSNIAHRSLELTFEKEGLELAEFLSGESAENHYLTIADQVNEAIKEFTLNASDTIVREITLEVLRQAFYNSTEAERVYYGKLSRTYALMFTLRNEPRIVEYFKSMSSNFVLFIGCDIIVRALSERYLAEEDQMTVNMLRILRDAGSTLILPHTVVEELHWHLKTTDYEFQHLFIGQESDVDIEIARHSSKILIRAYFYAKFNPSLDNRPVRWESFIEQICSYSDLRNDAASREQVKNYLIERFGLDYLDGDDMAQFTDEDEVQDLAEKIKEIKSDDALARNDARQILAVYGKRRSLKEDHQPNPYGYRTWWLTHETRVRRCTEELEQKRGAKYIVRPEFILNFIALSPTTEEVRKSYNTIFPTLLGVRLSNRMREDIFQDVMKRFKDMRDVDEARAKTKMMEMSNRLKGDRLKGDNFRNYEADSIFDKLMSGD